MSSADAGSFRVPSSLCPQKARPGLAAKTIVLIIDRRANGVFLSLISNNLVQGDVDGCCWVLLKSQVVRCFGQDVRW